MRQIKIWLSLALILSSATMVWAQNEDQYLDDAYYGKQDIKRIEAENKRKAAERQAEYLRQQKEAEARRAAALEEYKRKRKSYEIDAYNGHITIQNEDGEEEYPQQYRPRSERRGEDSGVYGEYSQRLRRFHSDGNTIIINNPDQVTIRERGLDRDYYGRSYADYGWDSSWDLDWGIGTSWYYPRYDSYYYPYRYSYWSGYPYSWSASFGYSPWYIRYSSGYYDGYYGSPYHRYGWYDPYYPSYYGYYGGYYGGYYDGYYTGRANRAYYEHYYNNPYSGSNARSRYSSNRGISAYEAYDVVRNSDNYNGSFSSSRYEGEYRGSARSRYNGQAGGYNERRSKAFDDLPQREQTRSYTPSSSYDSRSSSSSSSNSSYSGGSSRSGGGGSGRVRER